MKNNFTMVYDILTKYIFDADGACSEILFLIEKDQLLFKDFWVMFSTTKMLADGNILDKDFKKVDRDIWIEERIREFISEKN